MLSPEHVIPDDFTHGANGLPVRPRPCAGELAHGFLARVAQANGYETPAMLLTAMRQVGIRNKDDMPRYLQIPKDEWSRLGDHGRAIATARIACCQGLSDVITSMEVFGGVLRAWLQRRTFDLSGRSSSASHVLTMAPT
jgi:hypothetical protein